MAKKVYRNRGQQLLAQAVSRVGTIRALAQQIGESEGQLSHYLRDRVPGITVRHRLEDSLAIGFWSWDVKPRK